MATLKQTSQTRVDRFVDWFIRSEYVANWTNEKDLDFFNEPDRAARCSDAAEDGCDGKTHAEVIEDWREAFATWLRYGNTEYQGRCYQRSHDFPRFESAVLAHFDAVEEWHDKNGSLWQEIG